jgi:hypothetical protein
MATKEPRQNTPVDRGDGYEKRDASIKGLIQFAFWMAVVIAVTMIAMRFAYGLFKKFEPLGAQVSPLVTENQPPPTPPSPVLQVQPHQELVDYCTAQQKDVTSYGWVNQQAGVVHIPIDRAMDLVLTRGLPARAANDAPAGAPTVAPPLVAGGTDLEGQCGYLTEPTESESSNAVEKK